MPATWLPVLLAVCVLVALVVAKAFSDCSVVVSDEVAVEAAVVVVVKLPVIGSSGEMPSTSIDSTSRLFAR